MLNTYEIIVCAFLIGQELQYYREKSANEIADLESVAQAHYSRANRLSEELDYLRVEHAQLKAQVCILYCLTK